MSLMSLHQSLTPRDMAMWTARIYSRHWQQWLLLSCLAIAPVILFTGVLQVVFPEPDMDTLLSPEVMGLLNGETTLNEENLQNFMPIYGVLLSQAVQQIAQVFAQLIAFGVLASGPGTLMASAAYRGRPVVLGEALTSLRTHGGLLVSGFIIITGLLLLVLVASFLGTMFCIGVVGFGFAAYMYLAAVPMLAPAIVLENGTLNERMRIGWQYGKVRVWLILGAVIALIVGRLTLALPVDLLLALVGVESLVVATVFGYAIQVITLPFGIIFFTLLFEDTRDRFAAAIEPDEIGLPSLDGAPPPQMNALVARPLISGLDLSNMISVTIVIGVVFGLYMVTVFFLFFAVG